MVRIEYAAHRIRVRIEYAAHRICMRIEYAAPNNRVVALAYGLYKPSGAKCTIPHIRNLRCMKVG